MSTARINELVTAVRDRWLWVFGYIPQVDVQGREQDAVVVEGWVARIKGDEFLIVRQATGYCYCEGEIDQLGWIANRVIRYRVSEKLAAFTPATNNAPHS